MRIRIQIQGSDYQKLEKFTAEIKFIFFILKIAILHSVFPMGIRIRIQPTKMDADPDADPQHCSVVKAFKNRR
jgi:hypothetical protein